MPDKIRLKKKVHLIKERGEHFSKKSEIQNCPNMMVVRFVNFP